MKYFGIDRVIEPVGTIPSTAWKIDNSRELSPGEIRVSLDLIKIEESNFAQLVSVANYVDSKMKHRIKDIVNIRGKLQNPYTESGGVLCGKIEEIHPKTKIDGFSEGDEIVSLTSVSGFPIYIEEIYDIDYNYGVINCKGYAILFEAAKFVKKPEGVNLKTLLCALDEEGSMLDLKDVLLSRESKRVGILGSNLVEMLLYSKMSCECNPDIELIAILDSNSIGYISEKEFYDIFKDAVNKVYFVDMARPINAFKEVFEGEKNLLLDAIINLEDIKGSETVAALLVKHKGFMYHTGVKKNLFHSILAVDCIGKEVTIHSLDGYAKGVFDFAVELVKKLEDNFKVLENNYSKHSKKEIKKHSFIEKKGMEVNRIEDFVFMSPVTANLVDNALNVAKYDCNVVIQGETGVGKERVLDLIHQNSERKGKPCIKINCATIQENLAESEFFGYEKGSFTGASSNGKEGYFEMANNGTLFLDEIGSLPLAMQSKLLRVLQENSFYRVGGTKSKNVNVRVICANNIPLKQLVDEGKFREDLYYRLNICMIQIPPLRQRKEDIICLAETFIKRYSKKYGLNKSFSDEAYERLCEYHWPGNVRELENTVHRLYISEKDLVIESESIDRLLDDNVYNDVIIDMKTEVKAEAKLDFNKIMEEQEKRIIAYALKKEKTTRKAAEFLGLPQATLARKKIKYDL